MGYIYLNNAATTWPKPKKVKSDVLASLNLPYNESGRSVENDLIDYPKITRDLLSEFFHAPIPNNFQFTANATESLNILIQGFVKNQRRKIHVITTELEHNSVLRPLRTLEKEKKIELSIIESDDQGYIHLETIKKIKKATTKLAVINHASNVIGTVQDIAEISKYLHENGIFTILDISQSAGHVDLDFGKLNCDAFCFTGHKSLFGIPGIGGFYISNPELISPLKQGGTGIYSQYPLQPDIMPLKFEAGTLNYPGIVSLYSGIKFIQKAGLKRIQNKTRTLSAYIIQELSSEKNIEIYNKKPDIPIISFNIRSIDNDDVGYILLKQHQIIVRTGLHCTPLIHQKIENGVGCVRISLSIFNTKKQCELLVHAVKDICKSV